MQLQISVIALNRDVADGIGPALRRCGLSLKTSLSAEQYLAGRHAGQAICFVIDLPGSDGLKALELLRNGGVQAPAILIAAADADLPPGSLSDCGALDVLERPANKRALLGWIECVCAANLAIQRGWAAIRPAA